MEPKLKLRSLANKLPKRPGVYLYKDEHRTVLYVGKALSLKDRINSYFYDDRSKTRQLLHNARSIDHIETGSEFEALLLEATLIKRYRPQYNVALKDDKSYLYIFISTGEEFPKIFLSRKPKTVSKSKKYEMFEGLLGEYFGPFTSSRSAQFVLKMLRRSFPYCQQRTIGKRACFYSHIGLCVPCPSKISKLKPTSSDFKHLKQLYRKNVLQLRRIISGNFTASIAELEKEMKQYAKRLEYEDAAVVRNKVLHLKRLQTRKDTSGKFLENPNFYFEKQLERSESLRKVLAKQGLNLKSLKRIECFDISTLQGKYSTGSQVVFIDGIPEKSLYRRYKIRLSGKPNDVGMMREMLTRRLKYTDWQYPDLFILDGGKPQVSVISQLFYEKKVRLALVGLSKPREQIIIKTTGGFHTISLKKSNEALKLVQQIRDEAHRFAIAYNTKRRRMVLQKKHETDT